MRADAKTAATAALVVGVLPAALFGQEQECQFDPSDSANRASEAMQDLEQAAAEDSLAAFTEAWDALEDDLDSDNPVVFLIAAQVQVELGGFVQNCEQYLPAYPPECVHVGIGLQNFLDAEHLLDRYDELSPPECMLHGESQRYNGWVRLYNRGVNAYSAQDTEGAIQSFMLANELRPDMRTYNMAAGLQAQTGATDAAIETYRTALATDMAEVDAEQMRDAVRGLGDLLMDAGRGDEAAETYDAYLAGNPDDVVIRIRYAGVLADQDRADEAAAIYADILGRTDLSYDQWLEVGVGLYEAQNFEDAVTAFGNARQGNPYNKEAMENYVNASTQAGRPGPVIPLADTLTTWYPYDQLAFQLHATALGRADMNDQAMAVMAEGEAAALSFTFAQMAATSGGSYVVQVDFTARTASGTLQIPFEFLDANGQVAMTHTQTTDAAAGNFRFEVTSDVPLAGFRYGTIGG
ncbi:tetratricopeptide repeat protein [Candidatus Palauibacter sp.]|uniref:tetratricopeptide repeat protein n=1 Tax=Candidatus Palauibacter sp. TaxID=3101350 RepID=UPI003AF2CC0B